jgi:CRP-like cAMP-binding protein
MSISDDIAALERVPLLRELGHEALRMLAIGTETQRVHRGDTLFRIGDPADAGYVVVEGALRLIGRDGEEALVGPGALVSDLALVVDTAHDVSAVAADTTTVIRIARSLFQKVLESDAGAAVRMRDSVAARNTRMTAEIVSVKTRLTPRRN